jgi:two-component system cell cycle sensor histidine kinase/response regulator CckA
MALRSTKTGANPGTEPLFRSLFQRMGEEHLRRIFELVPAPLLLTRPDGVILDCNQAFCACSGFDRGDLIGRPSTMVDLPCEQRLGEDAEDDADWSDRTTGAELTIRRRDGKQRTLLVSARRLDVAGKPMVILAGQDITEKRALEQQMLHAQKLESLGVLAGGIAHDFNNLLTGILGNADLALRELSPLSPARESLDDIAATARRASELCRQLLAYSGKGRFVVQPLDLAELVREMGHLLAISISKHASLQYHFGADLPAIEGDATQIRQVVMNVIVNASEAIADRNGVIALHTGLTHCDAAYLAGCSCADGVEPGDFAFLEVSDNGHGMDRATLERIFDPFFTTKFTGRGLGLAAVLGIVRGHRGAIRVYSEPGRGTTFKLLFPPSPSQAHTKVQAPAPTSLWRGDGTVLLVDDEESVRKAGRRMLEQAGFSVLMAEDGRAAVELFRDEAEHIRLVVLDLTMPELDGAACFRALRQIKPDVKVLLTSGYNEQEAVNAFAGRGLGGFLQKPFTIEELVGKLREILEDDGAAKPPFC